MQIQGAGTDIVMVLVFYILGVSPSLRVGARYSAIWILWGPWHLGATNSQE